MFLYHPLLLQHAALVCPEEVVGIQAPEQAGEPNSSYCYSWHVRYMPREISLLNPTAPSLMRLGWISFVVLPSSRVVLTSSLQVVRHAVR